MRPNALVDSSFLFALVNAKDDKHLQARVYFEYEEHHFLLPETALTEIEYLLRKRCSSREVSDFLSSVIERAFTLISVDVRDIQRIQEIRTQYDDAKFDLVDCCLMAVSERHNITTIYTFDQRDFLIFRPHHTKHLELLP
jgi:predicted nucleic acid-binding protein